MTSHLIVSKAFLRSFSAESVHLHISLTHEMGLKSPISAVVGVLGINVMSVCLEACRTGFTFKICLFPCITSAFISGQSFLKNSEANPSGPGDLPILKAKSVDLISSSSGC